MQLEPITVFALVAAGYAVSLTVEWHKQARVVRELRTTVPVDRETGLFEPSVLSERLGMELRRVKRLGGSILCARATCATPDAAVALGSSLSEHLRFPTSGFRTGACELMVVVYAPAGVDPQLPIAPTPHVHVAQAPVPQGLAAADVNAWLSQVWNVQVAA